MKILIIKWAALGDVIRTSYILPGMYKKYNNPDIYWFTARGAVDLLRYNPYVYRVITQDTCKEVFKKESFDLVISLDEENHILKHLKKIHCRELFGAYLTGKGDAVYTKNSRQWFDMGLISRFGKQKADALKKENKKEHNQIFSEMLGIKIKKPEFYNSGVIETKMKKLFSGKYFNIGLNSAAGTRWPSKQLELSETVELINKLLTLKINGRHPRIHLLGGKEETNRHTHLRKQFKNGKLNDTGNNNTLLEFAGIIKNLDYVITSDSLALHMAISQDIPNLSFYAPTPKEEIGVFKTGVKIKSASKDYASYDPNADNSSITAKRIYASFSKHILKLKLSCQN